MTVCQKKKLERRETRLRGRWTTRMSELGAGRARLGREEDGGLNCTATQTAEAIFSSLMKFDSVTAGTAMRVSVRAADAERLASLE